MARCVLRPPAPTTISRTTFRTNWTAEPPASLQLPKARETLADSERGGDDRVVLGADHHRTDDEDLRIGQDAHGADQPGDGQQDKEARGIHRTPVDSGVHHFPHGSNLTGPRIDFPTLLGGVGERGVHQFHGNRIVVIKTKISQHAEHGVSSVVAHVEKYGVAVRAMSGPLEHDQVLYAGKRCKLVEQPPSDARRARDADVQHHESARADSRRIMMSHIPALVGHWPFGSSSAATTS